MFKYSFLVKLDSFYKHIDFSLIIFEKKLVWLQKKNVSWFKIIFILHFPFKSLHLLSVKTLLNEVQFLTK